MCGAWVLEVGRWGESGVNWCVCFLLLSREQARVWSSGGEK